MKIAKSVIEQMNQNISGEPPESGGILGSSNFEAIDEIVFDVPHIERTPYCYYSPNVAFLNQQIEFWQSKNILFRGVFHTHFANVQTLSSADKEYIMQIMKQMPENIHFLYFPIFVLPARRLVVYRAEKSEEGICIKSDALLVV